MMSKSTQHSTNSSKTKRSAPAKATPKPQPAVITPVKTPVRRISIHEFSVLRRMDMTWLGRLVSRQERKSVSEWEAWLNQISNTEA